MLGGGGFRRSPLLNWNDYISWTRITDSLMYTGFSVPLLDYLVKTVILDRGFGITTGTHPVLLYAFMALANGVYLSSHNLLRGLPKGAVYGNFFRSIISIPVAILINALPPTFSRPPVSPASPPFCRNGRPSSPRRPRTSWPASSRAWRTATATSRPACAITRASSSSCSTSMRSWSCSTRTSRRSRSWSTHPITRKASAEARDLEKIIMVHALDLLYFWMYQPRARTALRQFVQTLSEDERHILASSQFTLQRHREISQMFIDGILGDNFPRPLSFYLSRYAEYLESIKGLVFDEPFAIERR